MSATQGPWEVRIPLSTAARHPRYIVAGGRIIAAVYGGVTYDELRESIQNAHMIAAAPDLFDAATHALPYLGGEVNDPDGPISRLARAIAKATGASK